MEKQGTFQLDCITCNEPVIFSILDLDKAPHLVTCPSCGKKYGLGEETLKRQLVKFAALCQQIQESQEILGNASVAVEVGPNSVKVPFKLLLLRLKSVLDLTVGDTRLTVTFRVEPTTLPKA